jgi:hypothetical protein
MKAKNLNLTADLSGKFAEGLLIRIAEFQIG